MTLALINAVKNNNLVEVKKLLESCDVNYRHPTQSTDGEITALHLASSNGYLEIINILLNHPGTNVNALTSFGRTALHAAAMFGQVEACKLLLTVVDPAIKDRVNKTAYLIAKSAPNPKVDKKKYKEIVDLLAVPTFVNACKLGDLETVKRMVEEEKVDINGKFLNCTGFMEACLEQHVEVVEYLLTFSHLQVNLNLSDGTTLLHLLSAIGYLSRPHIELNEQRIDALEYIIELLIKNGADVNAKNINGLTPLAIAVAFKVLPLIIILVKNGADLSVKYPHLKNKDYTIDIEELAKADPNRDKGIIFILQQLKLERGITDFRSDKKITNLFSYKNQNISNIENQNEDSNITETDFAYSG